MEFAMFMRTINGVILPGKINQYMRLVEEIVLPTFKAQPGFKDVICGIDRSSGQATVTSFWDSETDLHAWLQGPARTVLLALEPVVRTSDGAIYEVVAIG